nr:type II restriction endonuclease [Mycoplasma sp. 1654_15]
MVETNFFNSTGSKFNSEIERFKILATESHKNNFEFIWIADGKGLKTQKEKLKGFFWKI